MSVLLGKGDGTFQDNPAYLAQHTVRVRTGSEPDAVAVADLSTNGIPNIVTANFYNRNATVLLGDGLGNFTPASSVGVGLRNTPLLADLTGRVDVAGQPILDSVVVDDLGEILFRQGLAGSTTRSPRPSS